MSKILLLIVFFYFVSCKNQKPLSLSDILSSECFWDRTGEDQVIGGLNSCYRFLPNGQCFFYYYNFYNKKITDSVYPFEDIDVIVPTSWSVVGDTLLIAQETRYRVLSFSRDTILVEGYKKDTMAFVKNCSTKLRKSK